jgi:trimeric autotransporter adhesin
MASKRRAGSGRVWQGTQGSRGLATGNLIHTTQNEIINEIQGDSALAAALNQPFMSGTGANDTGFQALPVGSDSASALAAATAQGATLQQIGLVFNAANDLAAGGSNSTNLSEFNTDYQAVATGVQNILNNPTELAQIESGETAAQTALTTLHLDTVLNQVDLQINKFDPEYAVDPVMAARSTNDNTLDIIDIVQNDANLNMAAGGNGTPATTGGFGEFPAYLNGAGGVNAHGGTIQQYQDDQAQTDFWSQFIAEANQIQTQLNGVANSTTPVPASDLNALISEIQNYQQFGASFDDAQGGVFGARFDNELLSGTLLADTNNSVAGLTAILNNGGTVTTAAAAQIEAAGSGFAADANDVSGNNLPLGGTNYNGASTTVAGATTPTGLSSVTATVPVSGEVDGNDHPTSGVNLAVNNEEFGLPSPIPMAPLRQRARAALPLQPRVQGARAELQPRAQAAKVALKPRVQAARVELQPRAQAAKVVLKPRVQAARVELQPRAQAARVALTRLRGKEL